MNLADARYAVQYFAQPTFVTCVCLIAG